MKTLTGNLANDALQDVDFILYFDKLDLIDEDCFQYLLTYVSEERIAYAQKYKKREDRILSIMAYIILRVGLFKLFEISELPQLFKRNVASHI